MIKIQTLGSILILLLVSCASTKNRMFTEDTWDPYEFTATDTVDRYYIDTDSFLIRYAHSNSYMSTLVGRMICDIDSTVSDSAKAVNPFAAMKNYRADTAAYRHERHLFSHVQVYAIKNGHKTPIGKEQYGYYVESGCYEDVPEDWVKSAKNSVLVK